MVRRMIEPYAAERLRNWFLSFMQAEERGQGVYVTAEGEKIRPGDDHRNSRYPGFLIGPSVLCQAAGMNAATGGRWFNPDSSEYRAEYIPFAEYLRALALALRQILREVGHPRAEGVTVVRAFLEAGYLQPEDLSEFLEVEGWPAWMREDECLGGLDLRRLNEEDRLVVEEMYRFFLFREEAVE